VQDSANIKQLEKGSGVGLEVENRERKDNNFAENKNPTKLNGRKITIRNGSEG
jgi:hypothetical protein